MFKIILVLSATGILFLYLLYSASCSNQEIINEVIPKMCESPSNKQLFYPLGKRIKEPDVCQLICKTNQNPEVSCFNSQSFVFMVNVSQKTFIVKSLLEDQIEDTDSYWEQISEHASIPSEEEFNAMVHSHILHALGQHESGAQKFYAVETSIYENKHSNLNLHREFWKFMNDQEFLFSLIYEKLGIFPKILGTCGSYYCTEFANPLLSHPHSMKKSLNIAIELINYIVMLDSAWDEPFHLCDLKLDHFGWSPEKNIIFLDLDSVETNSSLTAIFNNTENCFSDDDCSYFDCHSRCLTSGRCSLKRTNTNLQVICSKIFLEPFDISFFYQSSFFSLAISDMLKEALLLCSTNSGMTGDVLVDLIREESISNILHDET